MSDSAGEATADEQRDWDFEDDKVCQRCHGPVEQTSYVAPKYECPAHGEVIGIRKPVERVTCVGCASRVPKPHASSIDVSGPDEYYPDVEWLCSDCGGGSDD